MRKWIVIALIAVVAIGVGAYVLSQPKKGTVEWYRQRVIQLTNRAEGKALWRRILREFTDIDDIARPDYEKLENELVHSLRKLEELGYLERRRYLFTNRTLSVETIRRGVVNEVYNKMSEEQGYFQDWKFETNVLKVAAPRKDFPKWDDFVRRADVPESK